MAHAILFVALVVALVAAAFRRTAFPGVPGLVTASPLAQLIRRRPTLGRLERPSYRLHCSSRKRLALASGHVLTIAACGHARFLTAVRATALRLSTYGCENPNLRPIVA